MDICAEITSRIITQLGDGIIPWKKPWIGSNSAISYATGKPYSLLNQMLLGKSGEYLTYKQCLQAGGFIRKGEKARMIVFWKWLQQTDEETGEIKEIPFLRYYKVFHISQCEGIISKHGISPEMACTADSAAEAIISSYLKRSGVRLYHKDISSAFYRPSDDSISLPQRNQFHSSAGYYSTAFHELAHSTGHSTRLNRINSTAHFGSEDYSKEELVAEITAAALVNHAGLETNDSFQNNAAYIQNWLQVLQNDKRFIVSASSKAEKAMNLILGQATCKQNA